MKIIKYVYELKVYKSLASNQQKKHLFHKELKTIFLILNIMAVKLSSKVSAILFHL
jgi:hypothetical protein